MTTPVPTRPYVLVHAGGRTWQASGQLHRTRLLADVPAPAPAGGLPVVSMVPYCQIRERGYAVHDGGEEILVLQGLFRDEQGEYPAGTWLRSPRWSQHTPFTGPEGALIYVKVGHLGASFLAPPVTG